MGARNHNPCIKFPPDIDPTELQLFHIFFFRDLIEGVLLHNINDRIDGEKVSYGVFLVLIGLWLMMVTIQGP